MPFPVIEVRRLSPASSFYAAITQPLGIRYLSSLPALLPSPQPASTADTATNSYDNTKSLISLITSSLSLSSSASVSAASPSSSLLAPITFGPEDSLQPLFQLRHVPASDRPLNKIHIVFSASSPDAVAAFRTAALKACPQLALNPAAAPPVITRGDTVSSRITDLDGNTMETVYRPSYSYHSPSYSYETPSASRRYRPEHLKPPSRIISWSSCSPSGSSSPDSYVDMGGDYDYYYGSPSAYSGRYRSGAGEGTSSLRRSSTTTSMPRDKGVSTAGMLGVAAFGAAAGAALTYSMMSGERSSRSSRSRDLEEPMAYPSFQRRSTYPDPYPAYSGGSPSYSGRSRKDIREIEDVYDDDRSSRHSSSRHRSRSHSRGPRSQTQYLLSDGDMRSRGLLTSGGAGASSYVTARMAPPALVSRHSAPTYELAGMSGDRDSYVSASRSHRSSSTVRNGGSSSSRHHHSDRHSDRHHPPNSSRSASTRYVVSRSNSGSSGGYLNTARNVPLPGSGAGSSHARWDDYDDDDLAYHDDRDGYAVHDDPGMFDDDDSIAPSDSISCVGSRSRDYRSYR